MLLYVPDEDKPMAQAVKNLTRSNYGIMMFWHTKDESGKITGYVVDLSTTLMLTFKLFIRSQKTIIEH
jgi:hypothetical protein